MTKTVDLAVVGGGPGGLSTALFAARRGLSVQVFERKKKIGSPVKCGEYIPARQEMLDVMPKALNIIDLVEEFEYTIVNRCGKIRTFSPNGKNWEFPFKSHVLDRMAFENGLAEKAMDSGAEIELGGRAKTIIKNGEVKVGNDKTSVRSEILVAADGFPSKTASAAGLQTEQYITPFSLSYVMQYRMNELNLEEDVVELFFGLEYAPGAFAWIIPKSSRSANVGIGVRRPFVKSEWNVVRYLENFIHRHPVAKDRLSEGKPISMVYKLLPIDGPLPRTYTENLLVVGDAAGMVMPTNGGGILTALVTGMAAGEVASDKVQKGCPLSFYEEKWREVIGEELERSTRIRRVADKFMWNDDLFNTALRILGSTRIRQIFTCKVPNGLSVFSKLLSRDLTYLFD